MARRSGRAPYERSLQVISMIQSIDFRRQRDLQLAIDQVVVQLRRPAAP
jgi:hypothetical protein